MDQRVAQSKVVEELLEEFRQQRPIRSGSLIATVFGDSISPHGNSVWLSSLIRALEPFGLDSRLVRTAVFRLVQDNWLTSEKVGRCSYYSLTESALLHYEAAGKRIYAAEPESWDGRWTIVIPALIETGERESLVKELSWLGFGSFGGGILGYPGTDRESLNKSLRALQMEAKVVVMTARTEEVSASVPLQALVQTCWNLEELEQRYLVFIERFKPFTAAVARELTPQESFQVRTLLIHEYRRILLKDSELPEGALPKNWAGHIAHEMAANIYRAVHEQAKIFLQTEMKTVTGYLPEVRADYYERFGGL